MLARDSRDTRLSGGAVLGALLFCAQLLAACGPTVKPVSPPAEPEPITKTARPGKVDPSGRRVVIGEMCPQGAGGRPAVAPLVMRGVGWTDTASEVTATVERGSVPHFTVFGVDGKSAGTFETLGIVEVGIAQPVATGTYVGSSPCTYAGGKSTDARAEDPACQPATKGCGIAVGEITTPDEPERKLDVSTGAACISGNELQVDIDGDGVIESFPIAGALDGIRAPAAEWSASPTATPTGVGATACTPKFHVYGMKLAPPEGSGKSPGRGVVVVDKGVVTIDVLGVIDVDGDGRRELILAMKFPTVRTIVVYTATQSPQRLELAGEASSFK